MPAIADLLKQAVAHHQSGQLSAAEQLYRQILQADPRNADAWHFLGVVARQLGRPDLAVEHIGQALRIVPDFGPAHNNLGNALRDQGKLTEAEASYRQALRLNPDFAEAHYNLGVVLRDLRKLTEAEACYREVIRLKPDYLGAQIQLGKVLCDQGKLAEAETCFRDALRRWPDAAEVHNNLGIILHELGRLEEAERCCREALRLKPDFAEAHNNLGIVLQGLARLDEAERHLRQALRLDPRLASAWYQLATMLRARLPDADLDAMERLRADPHLTPGTRANLCFGLAQVRDARRDFDEAGEILIQANALTLDDCRRLGRGYDPAAHTRFVDRLLAAFDSAFFERVRGLGLDAQTPVFVIGLPRSGTTLTEQILARHSQVFGAGELTLARDNFLRLPSCVDLSPRYLGELTPARDEFLRLAGEGADDWHALENLGRLDGPTVRRMAGWHLDQLRVLQEGAQRVVDKLPNNYFFLGFLAALFPWAQFIHCRRDLRDVAVSCWMNSLPSQPWTSAFEHIAARFRDYERVMEHWRHVLPVPMLEVNYEEIVADLEGAARRLVSWCGLGWEPACLKFHEGTRLVRTASAMQVRRPIFSHSVGRWKHYQKSLAPLFDMLPQQRGE